MQSLGEATGLFRPRPEHLALTSLAVLYGDFSRLFLGAAPHGKHVFQTQSGHSIHVSDHNFFHLVKLSHCTRGCRFGIAVDLPSILGQDVGFGDYTVDKWRARALPTALDTVTDPDEVFEGLRAEGSATHCFWKWYGGGPSPYTVFLTKRKKGHFIPVTSFNLDGGRLKKLSRNATVIWKKVA
jgi:hypothetical protein